MNSPIHRYLSLRAGVQSMQPPAAGMQRHHPTFDAAILWLADTGWEPVAVYRHPGRLTRIAADAGIPIVRVHKGHIRRIGVPLGEVA